MKTKFSLYWFLVVFATFAIHVIFTINREPIGHIRGNNSYPTFKNVFQNEKYQNCSSLPDIRFISTFQSDWYNISTRGEVSVYSAYLIGINVIKIIGMSENKELFPFCQMWIKTGGDTLSLVSVHQARVIFLPESHKKRYTPSYLLCSFTTLNVPSAVSVVLDGPCAKPLRALPVVSSAKSVRRKFTVCVSPLFGSIGDQLIEWIEMNRILGAEFFVFYKSSMPEKYEKILTYYSERGLAEVNKWNNPLAGYELVHYNGQMAAINDCILRHRFKTDFIAMLDLDEFIIPRNQADTTWREMMKRLPHASSYIFQAVDFPAQWGQQKKSEINTAGIKYKLDIINKLRRTRHTTSQPKVILNPRTIDISGIHFVHEHSVGESFMVPEDIGLVHHYREVALRRKRVENNVSDSTVLKYRDLFLKNTQTIWNDLLNETGCFGCAKKKQTEGLL